MLVSKHPDKKLAQDNVVCHSSEDFGNSSILFKICDTVYKSLSHSDIKPGYIGLGDYHRKHHLLSLGDKVKLRAYDEPLVEAKSLKISMSFLGKRTNRIIPIHEDEFIDKLKGKFSDHYFYPNQSLVFCYNDNWYNLYVVGGDKGFVSKETIIQILTNEISINVIGSNTLRRELFRDDYNFEELGIGGLNKEMIGLFRRALSSRGLKSQVIEKLGIKHVKGVLLFGPPGTGKTLIARKIGGLITHNEPKVVNGPEILNKYVGQAEENIRNLFSDAKNSDDLHIIIFDEIDAICKKRGRGGTLSGVNDSLVNQLLSMMDGVHSLENIFIIGLTNRIDLLDEGLLRPGRFEVHVKVGLPDIEGRKQILRIHTKKMSSNEMMGKDVDVEKLAQLTENFSGAEIEAVVKNASSYALHEILASSSDNDVNDEDIIVSMEHFVKACSEIEPAFGSSDRTIKKILPNDFILTEDRKTVYDKISKFLDRTERLSTLLLHGENGSGKTSMALKVAFNKSITFTKIIRPIDIVNMDDHGKTQYITDIFMDAYVSKNSLIILDDIEILINYAVLGNSLTFSNKLYQTFMTVLKTPPSEPGNCLKILAICGHSDLYESIKSSFDDRVYLGYLELKEVKEIAKNFNIKLDKEPSGDRITMKQLLNLS